MDSFLNRIKPDSLELAHPLIKTKVWGDSMVIVFWGWNKNYKREYEVIKGYVFKSLADNRYLGISIDSISQDGGFPKIETVFYANADSDPAKELLIIVSRSFEHRGAGVWGTWYEVLAYDNLNSTDVKSLLPLPQIREKLAGGCDCIYEEGSRIDGITKETAKLKTAKDVKAKLKELGYK